MIRTLFPPERGRRAITATELCFNSILNFLPKSLFFVFLHITPNYFADYPDKENISPHIPSSYHEEEEEECLSFGEITNYFHARHSPEDRK